MKVILQAQSAECGLACLAMVSSHFQAHHTLAEMRSRFAISVKGATLEVLMRCARAMNFMPRAVRLELNELQNLAMPAILHWKFNHFVVVEKVLSGGRCTIVDPARGRLTVSGQEVSEGFTGVALELTPTETFERKSERPPMGVRDLMGRVYGLRLALTRIFLVALCLQVLAVMSPMFNQFMIDEAMARHDMNLANVMVIGFILLLVIQSGLGLLKGWMVVTLGQDLSLQWRSKVFRHLLSLPVTFFESRQIGDVLSRMGGLSAIQNAVSNMVISVILNAIMAVVAAALMVVYAWKLALIVFASALLYGLLRWVSYGPFRQASLERIELGATESSHFIETLRSVQVLKLFGKEGARQSAWSNIVVDVQNRDVQTMKMGQWFSIAKTFIFGVEGLLVFWLAARSIIEGSPGSGMLVTLGMFFAFAAYQGQFTGAVGSLIDAFIDLKMLSLQTERLSEIVLAEPEEDGSKSVVLSSEDLAELVPEIEFKDVGFRYGESDPWLFRNVSLRFRKGESIAIVGPSGVGKTTLLKVMLGLVQPTEGEVLYGGKPIQQLGLSRYRSLVGAVMQSDALIAGSILENIALYDDVPDDVQARECAKAAGVDAEIERMPMGYRTLVGDMGSGLSGGQQQRLFLARALYRRPRVLALDEATSHLDVALERSVIKNLKSSDAIKIMIAHRPQTIASANRIVEMTGESVRELAQEVVLAAANGMASWSN